MKASQKNFYRDVALPRNVAEILVKDYEMSESAAKALVTKHRRYIRTAFGASKSEIQTAQTVAGLRGGPLHTTKSSLSSPKRKGKKKTRDYHLPEDEFLAWNRGELGLRSGILKHRLFKMAVDMNTSIRARAPNGDILFYVHPDDNPEYY